MFIVSYYLQNFRQEVKFIFLSLLIHIIFFIIAVYDLIFMHSIIEDSQKSNTWKIKYKYLILINTELWIISWGLGFIWIKGFESTIK